MTAITDRLVPKLRNHFPDRPMQLSGRSGVAVTFPAAHPDFGDIEIQDDGHEPTISFGHFTHSHVANYEEGISESERAERIAEECVALLDDVFADRVEFFGSHEKGGGFGPRGERRSFRASKGPLFVWSGPVAK
jgi:hypothetical protein